LWLIIHTPVFFVLVLVLVLSETVRVLEGKCLELACVRLHIGAPAYLKKRSTRLESIQAFQLRERTVGFSDR
jgi:hypothetical protein